MAQLAEKYQKEITPLLKTQLGLSNILRVPRPQKIVVNIGSGRLKEARDQEEIVKVLMLITGQKPIARPARKAIASFKTRQGQIVGYKVTLRGRRMWDFLERLINIVLPRVRDFRGIPMTAVDEGGNLTIGLREHIVFPESTGEELRHLLGLEVTIVTSAKTGQEAVALFRALGFPLLEQ